MQDHPARSDSIGMPATCAA